MLVAGGAGAVGNAAIQLARWSDATVITTVSSPEKAPAGRARRRRPRHRLPRGRTSSPRCAQIAPDGVDTVVEVSPGRERRASTRGARAGTARWRSTPNNGGDELTLPVRPLDGAQRPLAVRAALHRAGARRRRRAWRTSPRRCSTAPSRVGDEAGLPLHHFPLEQAAEAHAAVEDGAVGKVLIDVIP